MRPVNRETEKERGPRLLPLLKLLASAAVLTACAARPPSPEPPATPVAAKEVALHGSAAPATTPAPVPVEDDNRTAAAPDLETRPTARVEQDVPASTPDGWLGVVTERLAAARDELTRCFDEGEVSNGSGIELRLDFDAGARVASRVVAGDNDACPAVDCVQAQIRKALSPPPSPSSSPVYSVPLVLRYHPEFAEQLELRTDGATLNLREIDCKRAAILRAQRQAREEARYGAPWKPLGSNLDRSRNGLEGYAFVEPSRRRSMRSGQRAVAQYLNAVHQAVHPLFADRYLTSLDHLPRTDPLNNDDLEVTIELVIDAQGRIARSGVVESSGIVEFDANALHSFATAAPFPPPPRELISRDGHAYLHWRLFRKPLYACSTYFARPFLLRP